jgi:hypothetical protein
MKISKDEAHSLVLWALALSDGVCATLRARGAHARKLAESTGGSFQGRRNWHARYPFSILAFARSKSRTLVSSSG